MVNMFVAALAAPTGRQRLAPNESRATVPIVGTLEADQRQPESVLEATKPPWRWTMVTR